MANTLKLLGYHVFRGSSSRGGARGLLGLIQHVRQNGQAALAVDGPKGPIYEVKRGIVELAYRTERPVVVVRVAAEKVWFIPNAWNRSYVPKPFSRIQVYFDEAIRLPARETVSAAVKNEQLDELCVTIKNRLDGIQFS